MAEIKIKDISIDGNDLFNDSEGFMDDLSADAIDSVTGGAKIAEFITVIDYKDTTHWTGPIPIKTSQIPYPCTIAIL